MFRLPCECGKEYSVDLKQAGTDFECVCGRTVAIPGLRQLKQLSEVDPENPLPRPAAQFAVNDTSHSTADQPAGRESVSVSPRQSPRPARNHQTRSKRAPVIVAALLTLAAIGLLGWLLIPRGDDTSGPSTVSNLVDTEEWILDNTPRLKNLNQAMTQLELSQPNAVELFAREFEKIDLTDQLDLDQNTDSILGATQYKLSVESSSQSVSRDDLRLWQPLLEQIASFERAKFYFVRADYAQQSDSTIQAVMGFEGLATAKAGDLWLVTGKMLVDWQPDSSTDDWKITRWDTQSVSITQRRQAMFQEVLDRALPDPELRERVRRSIHEERLAEILIERPNDIDNMQFSQLELSTAEHHPGLSVVDIDEDGFDDLYLMPRWGRASLLHNQGDGTFKDIAPELGLDIEDRCTSAVFADFDNDGDQDLMLGRSLEPSLYLVNEEGVFKDRSLSYVGVPMPSLVYAVSAADYNGDGLLDVFFATSAVKASTDALQAILPPEFAQRLRSHLATAEVHTVLSKPGPPNILLVNRGQGRFELAPEQEQIAVYKNTNQASWGDFDNDGDPDLYLSNDFSINTMLRNDGQDGFVDVTEETNTADIGFGMGAAWGDYDNDQQLDLYATNMYSKAGQRITSQLNSLDDRYANMARGNSLFKNSNGQFEKVSGLKEPKLQVEKAGWSWCGQFVDVDNDGFLDIYAPSGYYTAPPTVAFDVDL